MKLLKERANAELKAIQKLLAILARRYVPILALVCIFFAVDIHAFDDIALRFSAGEGFTELTQITLYLGADFHANEDQALRLAAQSGYTNIVKALLDHGANINVGRGVVLAEAIQSGNAETVKLILDRENFTPNCEPIWQRIRGVWLAEAQRASTVEIRDLVTDRVKPLSASCATVPSKTDFDHWK